MHLLLDVRSCQLPRQFLSGSRVRDRRHQPDTDLRTSEDPDHPVDPPVVGLGVVD